MFSITLYRYATWLHKTGKTIPAFSLVRVIQPSCLSGKSHEVKHGAVFIAVWLDGLSSPTAFHETIRQ